MSRGPAATTKTRAAAAAAAAAVSAAAGSAAKKSSLAKQANANGSASKNGRRSTSPILSGRNDFSAPKTTVAPAMVGAVTGLAGADGAIVPGMPMGPAFPAIPGERGSALGSFDSDSETSNEDEDEEEEDDDEDEGEDRSGVASHNSRARAGAGGVAVDAEEEDFDAGSEGYDGYAKHIVEHGKTTVNGQKKRIPAFVRKLRSMLDNKEVTLIKWTQDGEAFRVYDSVSFSKDVLPNYFKHNNWQSFIRQLNIYGFMKLSDAMHNASTGSSNSASHTPQSDWSFRHPLFLRKFPRRMEEIKRRTPKQPKPEYAPEPPLDSTASTAPPASGPAARSSAATSSTAASSAPASSGTSPTSSISPAASAITGATARQIVVAQQAAARAAAAAASSGNPTSTAASAPSQTNASRSKRASGGLSENGGSSPLEATGLPLGSNKTAKISSGSSASSTASSIANDVGGGIHRGSGSSSSTSATAVEDGTSSIGTGVVSDDAADGEALLCEPPVHMMEICGAKLGEAKYPNAEDASMDGTRMTRNGRAAQKCGGEDNGDVKSLQGKVASMQKQMDAMQRSVKDMADAQAKALALTTEVLATQLAGNDSTVDSIQRLQDSLSKWQNTCERAARTSNGSLTLKLKKGSQRTGKRLVSQRDDNVSDSDGSQQDSNQAGVHGASMMHPVVAHHPTFSGVVAPPVTAAVAGGLTSALPQIGMLGASPSVVGVGVPQQVPMFGYGLSGISSFLEGRSFSLSGPSSLAGVGDLLGGDFSSDEHEDSDDGAGFPAPKRRRSQ